MSENKVVVICLLLCTVGALLTGFILKTLNLTHPAIVIGALILVALLINEKLYQKVRESREQ